MTKLLRMGVALSGLAVGLSSVATARAQSFGERGDVSFAADRLMGIYLLDEGGDATSIGLGAPALGHIYTLPRLGIDGFVIDRLSLGGSLAFWAYDPEGPRGERTGFLLAPRVGYAVDFSDSFGIWPRGGLTFRDLEDDDEVALTLEAIFWGSPVPHFAFVFGPAFDIGVAGDGPEARSFGLVTAGVLGWI